MIFRLVFWVMYFLTLWMSSSDPFSIMPAKKNSLFESSVSIVWLVVVVLVVMFVHSFLAGWLLLLFLVGGFWVGAEFCLFS